MIDIYEKQKLTNDPRLIFGHASACDIDAVCGLYQKALGTPGCTWDEEYPSRKTAENDLYSNGLYVLRFCGKIIGAVSVVAENELDEFDCFIIKSGAREFARITVAPEFCGKGCALFMLQQLTESAVRDGVTAWHILAAVCNPSALALYRGFGFSFLGECRMYENNYYIAEKLLQPNKSKESEP